MPELQIEYEIQKSYEELDKRLENEAKVKAEAYQLRNELYKATYPAPAFYDTFKSEEGARPEIYPMILAQIGGLVRVLRWTPWAGAYAIVGIRREQYVHPNQIRFWLPMPEPVEPPPGFYDT